jgi:hypothetical protein
MKTFIWILLIVNTLGAAIEMFVLIMGWRKDHEILDKMYLIGIACYLIMMTVAIDLGLAYHL